MRFVRNSDFPKRCLGKLSVLTPKPVLLQIGGRLLSPNALTVISY